MAGRLCARSLLVIALLLGGAPDQAVSGSGSLFPYVFFPMDSRPEAVALGDVNGDGRTDLVLVTRDSTGSVQTSPNRDTLFVYLQDPAGRLAPPALYPAGRNPRSVAIGDLDGDGRLDVVVGHDGGIGVFIQDGSGSLRPMQSYPGPAGALVAAGDVTGDGRLDVVALTSGWATSIAVFRQQEDGSLGPPEEHPIRGNVWGAVAVLDSDQDGRQDVILTSAEINHTAEFGILHQEAGGAFAPPIYTGPGYTLTAPAMGDVTGDGRADLVRQWPGGPTLIVHAQDAARGIGSTASYPTHDEIRAVAIADINGDGRKDLVAVGQYTSRLGLYLQGPTGQLSPYETYPMPWGAGMRSREVAVGDISGDGAADVVLLCPWEVGFAVLYGAGGLADPLADAQWHLRPHAAGGIDATGAWLLSRGAGVAIGVVDEGLQHTHPDLLPNYAPSLSWDFNDNDPDPAPRRLGDCFVEGECHATAVAGVAAARGGNALGVSGVAPEATLAGIRLIAGPLSDAQIAEAFAFQPDAIHILNNSWGPMGGLVGMGPLTEAALEGAATQGRGGKGRIFVRAAGNQRELGDNCNYDGFANSRHVIAVGAVAGQGQYLSNYSEPCSALFVTAPSSDSWKGITTTDLVGEAGYDPTDYTSHFGGTSASAPMVSGVVALMLSRNPSLTGRDVKHILARTSRLNEWLSGSSPGYYPHNEDYGFGVVDARAAVSLAAAWAPVAPEAAILPPARSVDLPIPDCAEAGVTDSITIGGEHAGFSVEHVEVLFSAAHAYRGSVEVSLTSPGGVVSRLAPPRFANDPGADFTGWRFGSAHHWGESPVGSWTLRVADRYCGVTGRWGSWGLRIYGTPAQIAAMTAPAPGSLLAGRSATFAWTGAGPGADYRLLVGTTVGGAEIHNGAEGAALSADVSGLPVDGRTVHVRLYTRLDDGWRYVDYRYTAASFPTFGLGVAVAGPGSVSSNPPGIACGADCAERYVEGTVVTLAVGTQAGGTFLGWGGACSGTDQCALTMDGDKQVTATFGFSVWVSIPLGVGQPHGRVTGPGIDCGAGGTYDCNEAFPVGTPVTLTGAPLSGYRLDRWTGCDLVGPDGSSCSLTIAGSRSVSAVFLPAGESPHVRIGSGNTTVIAVDPLLPSTLYTGTSRSTDGGATWELLGHGLVDGGVSALEIDPRDPATLYAGSYYNGVLVSRDGGAHWAGGGAAAVGGGQVFDLALDPGNPTTLYAGTTNGPYKSTDGGATWARIGLQGTQRVAVDPSSPATLYAGTSLGVFKSTDGGATWTAATSGMGSLPVSALVLDPQAPATLYAGVYSSGVFKSTDGGATWAARNDGLWDRFVRVLAIDPETPATLYAGTAGGVFRSTDGGATWAAVNAGLTDIYVKAIRLDPAVPSTLYVGTPTGLFRLRQPREEPQLFLDVNRGSLGPGSPHALQATLVPGTSPAAAQLFIALQPPDGRLRFLGAGGSLGEGAHPAATMDPVPAFVGQFFGHVFTGGEPAGTYRWLGVYTDPRTGETLGPIAESPPLAFSPGGTHPLAILAPSRSFLRSGDRLTLRLGLSPQGGSISADVYVALECPDGGLLFLRADGTLTSEMVAYRAGWAGERGTWQVFSHTLAGGEAPGTYRWLAGFTAPGTTTFIGPIVSAPFSFQP